MAFRQRFRRAIGALSATVLASAALGALYVGTAAAPAGATSGTENVNVTCGSTSFGGAVPPIAMDIQVNGTATPNTVFPTGAAITVGASSITVTPPAGFGAGLAANGIASSSMDIAFKADGTHTSPASTGSHTFSAPSQATASAVSWTTGSGSFGSVNSAGADGDTANFSALISSLVVTFNTSF